MAGWRLIAGSLNLPRTVQFFQGKKSFQFAIFLIAVCAYVASARANSDCFDNVDWKSLLSSRQSVLVYVWSPRMVMSATQAASVRAEVSSLGLDWVALHDDRIPATEVSAALEALQKIQPASAKVLAASRPLCASAVHLRDAYLHFPTAFLLRDGVVHGAKMIGAMPPTFWRAALLERLDQLKTPGATPETTALQSLN